jgi:hypothetical protein
LRINSSLMKTVMTIYASVSGYFSISLSLWSSVLQWLLSSWLLKAYTISPFQWRLHITWTMYILHINLRTHQK